VRRVRVIACGNPAAGDDGAGLAVVPELRRRGLRPAEYRGPTLRDNMGLVHPADPFLQETAAKAS